MMKMMSIVSYALITKLILFTCIITSTIFVLSPFINGLGCNFVQENDSETYFQKGYCKSGIIIIETRDKITGEVKIKKMLWGFWGGYNYTWHISTKIIKNGENLKPSKFALYSAYRVIAGYRIAGNLSSYWVYDQPFEVVYTTENKGRLGFFQ